VRPLPWHSKGDTVPVYRPDELIRDHRSQVAMEAAWRLARRREELAELGSDAGTPGARIQAWERLHGLRLPTTENHPVIHVIATATHLPVAEILSEQRARTANTRSPGVVSATLPE
jgi:hypothetical protein